jgi:hypothetical protein
MCFISMTVIGSNKCSNYLNYSWRNKFRWTTVHEIWTWRYCTWKIIFPVPTWARPSLNSNGTSHICSCMCFNMPPQYWITRTHLQLPNNNRNISSSTTVCYYLIWLKPSIPSLFSICISCRRCSTCLKLVSVIGAALLLQCDRNLPSSWFFFTVFRQLGKIKGQNTRVVFGLVIPTTV